jgi:hypothetical protein
MLLIFCICPNNKGLIIFLDLLALLLKGIPWSESQAVYYVEVRTSMKNCAWTDGVKEILIAQSRLQYPL